MSSSNCEQPSQIPTATSGLLPAPKTRPDIEEIIKHKYDDVGEWPQNDDQLPIVYNEIHNIRFWGLEKLHPFDACKFRKVMNALVQNKIFQWQQTVKSKEVTDEILSDVHTTEYLNQLRKNKLKVVQVTEFAPALLFPMWLVDSKMMKPMRFHVGGTMLAVGLAAARGWAINIGGGMHHASYNDGMGWCAYSDIMLGIRKVRKETGGLIQKCLVIDCDVHQGNGVARDKIYFKDKDVYILDVYNSWIWPGDGEAKAAIDIEVALPARTQDQKYLQQLELALQDAGKNFYPDLIVYNAGTDILIGDPLGRMSVSQEGILKRDEMVWKFASSKNVPICMLLSGGYARDSAQAISLSLKNILSQIIHH